VASFGRFRHGANGQRGSREFVWYGAGVDGGRAVNCPIGGKVASMAGSFRGSPGSILVSAARADGFGWLECGRVGLAGSDVGCLVMAAGRAGHSTASTGVLVWCDYSTGVSWSSAIFTDEAGVAGDDARTRHAGRWFPETQMHQMGADDTDTRSVKSPRLPAVGDG